MTSAPRPSQPTRPPGYNTPPPAPGTPPPQPVQRYAPIAQPTLRPRKVRGGVKLSSKVGPVSLSWAGQRWMRLIEELAPGDSITEGTEYARLGQTRALTINSGHVHARVQGRMPAAYAVDIRLPVFTFDQWEGVISTMVAEARPLAALLSGDVPPNIEDFFSPARLHLFPSEASHLSVSCNCGKVHAAHMAAIATMPSAQAASRPPAPPAPPANTPYCKHVCCVMALIAERLGQDTFLIMQLRGLAKEDLLERLRQRRAIAPTRPPVDGAPAPSGLALDRPVPIISPQIPGLTDRVLPTIDQHLERFWSAGDSLDEIDLPITPPEVSHPLLRRLGSSPFATGKFPLIGLLSTCYTVISEKAIAESIATPGPDANAGEGDDESPMDDGMQPV